MMEKLERLVRRRPRPEEDGEQSKSAEGLRWYHKAFLVPVFALAVFGAASVATPDEALAHEGEWRPVYGQPNPNGGYNTYCYHDHVHIFNAAFYGERGCMEIDFFYWGSGYWVWVPSGHDWPTHYLSNGYWYPVG
jgi:hypothetical protein